MAVEALPSKFSMKWNLMCGLVMLFLAGYFYYDGHYNKNYIDEHMKVVNEVTGEKAPDMDLKINQVYGPIGCGLTALYFGYLAWILSRKKIVVDEKGIAFSDGRVIPLTSLTKIDKSLLKTKGRLTIEYELDGKPDKIILKDMVYDGINDVLQEILRLTGKDKETTTE